MTQGTELMTSGDGKHPPGASPVLRAADAGRWLSRQRAWHEDFRAVAVAVQHGMTLHSGERTYLDACLSGDGPLPDGGEAMTRRGGLLDRALEHLEALAPRGYHFDWDCGELSLTLCSEMGAACRCVPDEAV